MSDPIAYIKGIPLETEKKVVLAHGCFDLLHPGHIAHLKAAAQLGSYLVVSITSDKHVNKGPGRPYFSEELRLEQMKALRFVDYVYLCDHESAIPAIEKWKPHIFVKGSEYRDEVDETGKIDLERAAVEEHGGELVFTDEPTWSSSAIINTQLDSDAKKVLEFAEGHDITYEKIMDTLEDAKRLKVLVIGETIMDEYVHVKTTSTPSKQSVVSCQYVEREEHAGGALATHNLISHFNERPMFASIFPMWSSYPSTYLPLKIGKITKTRYIDDMDRIMFKVDTCDDSFDPAAAEKLIKHVKENKYDLVVVNDFGHGLINEATATALCDLVRSKLCINTQTNSLNRGYNLITKYKAGAYASIDLPEARLATSNKDAEPDELARTLMGYLKIPFFSITHGKYGSYLVKGSRDVFVPAMTARVVDTTGAGDAYFGITSLLTRVTDDIALIGFIGNVAGALATQYLGNQRTVNPITLRRYLKTLLKR